MHREGGRAGRSGLLYVCWASGEESEIESTYMSGAMSDVCKRGVSLCSKCIGAIARVKLVFDGWLMLRLLPMAGCDHDDDDDEDDGDDDNNDDDGDKGK